MVTLLDSTYRQDTLMSQLTLRLNPVDLESLMFDLPLPTALEHPYIRVDVGMLDVTGLIGLRNFLTRHFVYASKIYEMCITGSVTTLTFAPEEATERKVKEGALC